MRERNFGLDLLRASAILFVLFNHVANHFVTFNRSTVLGDVSGIFGVELFFVLSGFLIGRIVLTELQHGMSTATIKRFYLRRWFRTLPLYYFLLIVFLIMAAIASKAIPIYPLHFVFLQNFFPETLKFFSVSWSLAIEEWFYLTLPLLLALGYKIKFFTKKTIYFIIMFIIGIIILRLVTVSFFDLSFDDVRKHIFLRFDSLLIGVVMAGMKLHDHRLYRQFQKPISLLIAFFCIALMAIAFIKLSNKDLLNSSVVAKAFGFPLLSMFIAMTIPFFETSKLINKFMHKVHPFRWTITWISLLSYSLYLIHLVIFEAVRDVYEKNPDPFMSTTIALGISFAIAFVLYRFIEKPFMDMRKKFG